jgi:hypothetical protein
MPTNYPTLYVSIFGEEQRTLKTMYQNLCAEYLITLMSSSAFILAIPLLGQISYDTIRNVFVRF